MTGEDDAHTHIADALVIRTETEDFLGDGEREVHLNLSFEMPPDASPSEWIDIRVKGRTIIRGKIVGLLSDGDR